MLRRRVTRTGAAWAAKRQLVTNTRSRAARVHQVRALVQRFACLTDKRLPDHRSCQKQNAFTENLSSTRGEDLFGEKSWTAYRRPAEGMAERVVHAATESLAPAALAMLRSCLTRAALKVVPRFAQRKKGCRPHSVLQREQLRLRRPVALRRVGDQLGQHLLGFFLAPFQQVKHRNAECRVQSGIR